MEDASLVAISRNVRMVVEIFRGLQQSSELDDVVDQVTKDIIARAPVMFVDSSKEEGARRDGP